MTLVFSSIASSLWQVFTPRSLKSDNYARGPRGRCGLLKPCRRLVMDLIVPPKTSFQIFGQVLTTGPLPLAPVLK